MSERGEQFRCLLIGVIKDLPPAFFDDPEPALAIMVTVQRERSKWIAKAAKASKQEKV